MKQSQSRMLFGGFDLGVTSVEVGSPATRAALRTVIRNPRIHDEKTACFMMGDETKGRYEI